MWQVTLSQLKMNARRFIAVSLAVLLAVAFLVSALVVGSSTRATLAATYGAQYSRADVVIRSSTNFPYLTRQQVDQLRSASGYSEFFEQLTSSVVAGSGRNSINAALGNVGPENLQSVTVMSGRLPVRDTEISLDSRSAADLGVGVGGNLTLADPGASQTSGPSAGPTTRSFTITGITAPVQDPFRSSRGQLLSTKASVLAFAGSEPYFDRVQLLAAPGITATELIQNLSSHLSEAVAQTPRDTAMSEAARQAGGQSISLLMIGFAVIALFVAMLVVSNTFAVLVAQRSRELALLRCVGASTAQVRGSVLVESAMVGLVASVFGSLLGLGAIAGLITLAQGQEGMEFATLDVEPSALAVGVVAGVILTVLAAWLPARAATRVAPLAALRPAEDARVGNGRGRFRLVSGLVLLVAGSIFLGLGTAQGKLELALPGGMAAFLGLLFCGTLFVPATVSLLGRGLSGGSVPTRLAALNAVRNPGRSAATANALMVGVTLVTMMVVGSGCSTAAFNKALDSKFSMDLTVSSTGLSASGKDGLFTSAAVASVGSAPGVSSAAGAATAGVVKISEAGQDGRTTAPADMPIFALAQADATHVVKNDAGLLRPGVVLVPKGYAGGPVTITGKTGRLVLEAVPTKNGMTPPLMTLEDADKINPGIARAGFSQIWVSLSDSSNGDAVRQSVAAIAEQLGLPQSSVDGPAAMRAAFTQILNVMLAVVLALLAVAVFIALIGVANTMSLSVLERTRENSLLRALGLTRRQLRNMLAMEAALVAGVAALLGTLFGMVFGWIGAKATFGTRLEVPFDASWLIIAAVFVVAIGAGVLASVLPARRAAALSPIEGLAAD